MFCEGCWILRLKVSVAKRGFSGGIETGVLRVLRCWFTENKIGSLC